MFARRNSPWEKKVGGELPEDLWDEFAGLGREVCELACPAELGHYETVLAGFRAGSQKFFARKPLRPPVGIGVDIAMITPYVLAALSFLVGAAVNRISDKAVESLGDATMDAIQRI